MKRVSRREFLHVSSGVAVGASLAAGCVRTRPGPAPSPAVARRISANEKIVLGFVGVAGRGKGLMDWFAKHPDVEIGAVCDVYERRLNEVVAATGGKAKPYRDFRKLLEQPDIDAVVVATPPHWHPLVTIYACQAGKDVYCEKPMCLKPVEGRAMVKAARENRRVTQVGTQIHAGDNYRRVVEIVRSGVLGKLSIVHTVLSLNEAPNGIGRAPNSDPPEGLDWDMWLGPAPKVPFNIARFKDGQHRYFADYVGSWLNEMGPHIVDLPVWALELGSPEAVSAVGGKFATDDISEIPDTMEVVYEYPGLMMTWSNMCANSHGLTFQRNPGIQRRLGVSFHGVNGTLTADYDRYELIGEGDRLNGVQLPERSLPRSAGHEREFLDCIKSRELPSCDVEKHYPLHVALNLGNIAMKVGRKLRWDAKTEQVVGDKEANAMLEPRYRSPWSLPV